MKILDRFSTIRTDLTSLHRCLLEYNNFLRFLSYIFQKNLCHYPVFEESTASAMESICFACTHTVNKADEIMCNGFCKSSFHLKCVHQSTEIRNMIASCAQLFWMCKACTKMMSNANFRQAISSTNSVMESMAVEQTKVLDELRKEIALNTTKINTILDRTPLQTTPLIPRPKHFGPSRKRPRLFVDETSQHDDVSAGTKEIAPDESIPLAAEQRQDKFWLYLSGFDPQATVQQIEKLVKSNLNTDSTVDVVKLVPKGRTLDELTFVSFKIGLETHLKDTALSGSSWQKGITFRQFDFGHSSSTRKTFRFQPTPRENSSQ